MSDHPIETSPASPASRGVSPRSIDTATDARAKDTHDAGAKDTHDAGAKDTHDAGAPHDVAGPTRPGSLGGEGAFLEACSLHKSFGKGAGRNHVLRGLDFAVPRGAFCAIMGPSGCGKSTLLHILGLMSRPDDGVVRLDGEPLPTREHDRNAIRRRKIGFVFQRFNLLGELSARDNVRLSLRVRGLRRMDRRIDELFEAMCVSHVADHKPGEMSIGEQQRVAVARALAHEPDLLLADEPTGSLDTANGEALLDLLSDIHRQRNQTIVMITHAESAAERADTVLTMKDGRI